VAFFDALRVKIRDDGVVSNKAVYLALGIQADGQRDVLGLWIEQTEGAKFWLKVFNELRARCCLDILIAVVDGLKGLQYASYKDRKVVAQDHQDPLSPQSRATLHGCTHRSCNRSEPEHSGLIRKHKLFLD
jgi:hypothetical protein